MTSNVKILEGKTLTSIYENGYEIQFIVNENEFYTMYHSQSCCESVEVEDICGDLRDLLNSPILLAEEVSGEHPWTCLAESYTWTFYKFSTIKGSVTIRWLGTSNGYYSEEVSFKRSK